METSSMRLPSVEDKPATLFVALELSKSTWLVAIHAPAADKISQHRLAGGDVTALLSLIERKHGAAEVALLRPVRVMSCYEAGYDGLSLHRLLCGHGIDNRVLDAASISDRSAFSSGQDGSPGCDGLVADVDGAGGIPRRRWRWRISSHPLTATSAQCMLHTTASSTRNH